MAQRPQGTWCLETEAKLPASGPPGACGSGKEAGESGGGVCTCCAPDNVPGPGCFSPAPRGCPNDWVSLGLSFTICKMDKRIPQPGDTSSKYSSSF